MNITGYILKGSGSKGNHDKGRRSFIWKAGAGLSALIAAAVPGIAGAGDSIDKKLETKVGRLTRKINVLEHEKEIGMLHQAYENFIDRGMYEEAVGLFADDGEAVFNGGIFKGKNHGVSRLFCKQFRTGSTGKKISDTSGILPDIKQVNKIEVAPDCNTACASYSYSIQAGTPIVYDSILVEMARQVGRGIMKWWEGGTCEVSYIRDVNEGTWKIKRLAYNALSRKNYQPGKTFAGPVSISSFSKLYPEDPAGPDRLV